MSKELVDWTELVEIAEDVAVVADFGERKIGSLKEVPHQSLPSSPYMYPTPERPHEKNTAGTRSRITIVLLILRFKRLSRSVCIYYRARASKLFIPPLVLAYPENTYTHITHTHTHMKTYK